MSSLPFLKPHDSVSWTESMAPSPPSGQSSTPHPPVNISAQRENLNEERPPPSPLGREGSTEASVSVLGSPAPLPDPSLGPLTTHRLPADGRGRHGPVGPGALGHTCRAGRGRSGCLGACAPPPAAAAAWGTPGVGVSAREGTALAASRGGPRPPGGAKAPVGFSCRTLRAAAAWGFHAGRGPSCHWWALPASP